MATRVTSSDQVYQERVASNLNKLRALLREALEVANATPVHDDGHPGGTYRYIKEALENIDGAGATDHWAEVNEWPAPPVENVFNVNDGVSWSAGTDCLCGTVTRVSKSGDTVWVTEDKAKLLNGVDSGEKDALHFQAGGFVGHTSGTQRWAFERNPDGRVTKFTRRAAGWLKQARTSSRGSMAGWGILGHGRSKHYDYNF